MVNANELTPYKDNLNVRYVRNIMCPFNTIRWLGFFPLPVEICWCSFIYESRGFWIARIPKKSFYFYAGRNLIKIIRKYSHNMDKFQRRNCMKFITGVPILSIQQIRKCLTFQQILWCNVVKFVLIICEIHTNVPKLETPWSELHGCTSHKRWRIFNLELCHLLFAFETNLQRQFYNLTVGMQKHVNNCV